MDKEYILAKGSAEKRYLKRDRRMPKLPYKNHNSDNTNTVEVRVKGVKLPNIVSSSFYFDQQENDRA